MTAPDAENRLTPGDAPVAIHEAEALDAWLESVTSRHVERSRDISRRGDRSPNCRIEPDTSLQATAAGFHARFTQAEHAAEPDVPVDAIWEKVMATTTASASQMPGRAAELVSARPARPTSHRVPDHVSAPSANRQRIVPAWLTGSHWAVSALMVAAVVIGIVALYGSFAGTPGSDDDPAINPNFAMGTPNETATPTPNIDRWLADPATFDCERDPAGSVDSTTWATDRPTSAENYLPFAPVAPADGLTLADRWWYLNANCAPTAEDPFVSDDFGWMQGLPFGNPTADQIASAQEISAALPMRDYQSYYIIREPAMPATPDVYSGPTGRLVLLPEDVVQLADGRVGGPLRLHIQTDDPDNAISDLTGGLEAAGTLFVVFEQVDGLWLFDEQFAVCVGDCNSFWTDLDNSTTLPDLSDDATPVATTMNATPATDASMDWLAPITADECDVEETRALEEVGAIVQDQGQIVPREYSPVTEVEASLAQDVAGANRVWESCRAQGLIGERRAQETLRYIAEIEPYNVMAPYGSDSYDDWVALNETMRASFLDPDTESYLVESEALPAFDCETGSGETDLSAQVSSEVIQPQHLVQLPDGRIGGPVTSLVGSGFLQCLETRPPAMNSGYQGAYIHTFAQDPTRDNRWALDERFWVCVSGCEFYYEETAYLSAYFYPPWPATPEAATPVAGTASLQPITPEECDVEALSDEEVSTIAQGSGEDTERSYAPTGPVHDALAQEVAEADRAWQSCFVYGTADERAALQSPRLTREGPGDVPGQERDREDLLEQLERFDATRELGEVMLSGNWRDYLIESDLFLSSATPNVDVLPDFIPTIPIPEQAVHLGDGRIAIPVARLLPPGSYPFSVEGADEIPYSYVTVHILVQDPALVGRWVVDETLNVCMGDCDIARAEGVEYIDYADSLGTPGDATPATTPSMPPATPESAAADSNAQWLLDPDQVVCTRGDTLFPDFSDVTERPSAIEHYLPFGEAAEAERHAVASQYLLIQANCAPNAAGEPAVSDDFSVMTHTGEGTVTEHQFDTAVAISDALALVDPMSLVIEGEPLPDSASTGGPMASKRNVLLPDDVVLLPDGRLGAPLRAYMQTNHPGGMAGWIADRGNWLEAMFAIFEEQDGILAFDEIITLCIGDCDDYWNFHRVQPAGTPEATPVATPQTRRDWRVV